jgi:hypothetical protein
LGLGVLRRRAIAAGTTAEYNGFSYGLLHARGQQIARQAKRPGLGGAASIEDQLGGDECPVAR